MIFFLKAITVIKKLEIKWKVNLTKSYSVEKEPLTIFRRWFEEAKETEINDPDAIASGYG